MVAVLSARNTLQASGVGSLTPDPACLVIQKHVEANLVQMPCDKYI